MSRAVAGGRRGMTEQWRTGAVGATPPGNADALKQVVDAPGAKLCVEAFGAPGDPAVLLIAGMAQSMDWWEPAFCARLAGAGRFVVRYDHRDTGGSTRCPPGSPDYGFDELGTDPLRVLDALGVDRAHLVGMSMGGGIT